MPLSAHALFCYVRISRQSLQNFRQYATRVAGARWRASFVLIGGVRVRARRFSEVTTGYWPGPIEHRKLVERKPRAAHNCRGSESARKWAGEWRTALTSGKSSANPAQVMLQELLFFKPSHKTSSLFRPDPSQKFQRPEGSIVRSRESCSSSEVVARSITRHSCCSCRSLRKVIRDRYGLTILTDFVCRLVRTTDWRLLLGMKLVRPIFLVCGLG